MTITLRKLLLIMTVLGIVLAYNRDQAVRRAAVFKNLETRGARMYQDGRRVSPAGDNGVSLPGILSSVIPHSPKSLVDEVRWNTGWNSGPIGGLADLQSFTELKRLSLSGSKLSDADFQSMPVLEHLEELDLYGTEITGASLQELRKHPRLREVLVGNTNITGKEVYEFRAQNPHISIYR